MKTRNALALFTLCGLVSLAIGVQALTAQNAPAAAGQNGSIKLPGSSVKTEDIAQKCDAVFIGEITEIGPPVTRAAGQAAYHGVQVKILRVLRGSIEGPIVVSLYAVHMSGVQESPPQVGNSYIFFVNKKDHVTVLKLLPATDDDITAVKKLLPAAPAPK